MGAQAPQDLGSAQLALAARAAGFLEKEAARGTDVALSPECFLSGWARGPGYARLEQLAGKPGAYARLLLARAKDAAHIGMHGGYEVIGSSRGREGFDRMVVSWARQLDFVADGAYVDRYFRASSRESTRTLWFLVAVEPVAPAKLDPNVRVFRKKPGAKRFDGTRVVRRLAFALNSRRRSGIVDLAEQISSAVGAQLRQHPVQRLVLPYEAQPFQHAVCRFAKAIDPNMETVGYLHSALPPLPTDLMYRDGAPDRVMVHGRGQAGIMVDLLGWPARSVQTMPALRYRVGDPCLEGFVLLPFDFEAADRIESSFRQFLEAATPASVPPLSVRNHPLMQESRRHRALTQGLERIMREYSDRFATVSRGLQPLSVFIGATAAIIEALEHGVSVVHICSRPLTEAHTDQIWKGIEVERIGEFVFRYRLRANGEYIQFGSGLDVFDRYL